MKTLFTLAIIGLAMMLGTPIIENGQAQELEMQLKSDEMLQDKVKIFDFEGNLLKEMMAEDVAQNEITVSDFILLESSDFAFSYSGDYYYLRN